VHLVGFIIRIYHDARSPERQIHIFVTYCRFSGCQYTKIISLKAQNLA